MYDRPVPTENTARTLAFALALWAGAVLLAGHAGAFAKFSPLLFATLVAFGLAFAAATYYLDRGVRQVVDAIDLRVLALVNLWRIPAGAAFLAWGSAGLLPEPFARVAGWGDIAIGLAAVPFLFLKGTRAAHIALHAAGLADLVIAVGLGLTFTLRADPAMASIALLPLVLIPLFGVPLTGAMHIAALDRLVRQGAWQPRPASPRMPSVSPLGN